MKITPANGHRAPGQETRVVALAAPNPRHGHLATIAFLFVALFLTVCWAGKSFGQAAQKYDEETLPANLQDAKNIKQLESVRKGMAGRRNVDTNSRDWRMFTYYYKAYIFKKMTREEARGELSGIVNDILKDLNRAQRSNATAAPAILQWSVEEAGNVASGNYHPAARINATILLGHLDEKPADNRTGTPPTPSARTLAPLRALWEDEDNPDGVRAAALQGLRRWVAYGFRRLPADDKTAIQDSMFQLATAAPPTDRQSAAHGFMQRYAVDILYVLNDDASAQKLTDTLVQLSSDADADPVISLYAAQKLARLGDEIKPVANPADVAKAWSTKAADIFGQESVRLVKMERPKAVADQPRLVDPAKERQRGGGGPGGYGPGGYGGGEYGMADMGGYEGGMGYGGDMEGYGGDMGYGDEMGNYGMGYGGARRGAANPQPIEVIAARRKLNHALQSFNYGLTGSPTLQPPRKPAGVVQATAEADRGGLQQLVAAIATAVENINDPQYDTREKFAEMVEKEADALRKLSRRIGGDATPDADPGRGPATAPGEFDDPSSPDVAFANPRRE